MKKVKYNGGREYWNTCTEPDELVVGQEYLVIHEEVGAWQTNYILLGVEGEFNSCWFDVVKDTTNMKRVMPKVYLALSSNVPVKGQKLCCSLIEKWNGIKMWRDSEIDYIEYLTQIGENVWAARTYDGKSYVIMAAAK